VIFRTNSLPLTVVKASKFRHITRILRSLHWLKITDRIEYKLFSRTHKILATIEELHTFITSSLFNILAVLAFHPSLHLLGHRRHPL